MRRKRGSRAGERWQAETRQFRDGQDFLKCFQASRHFVVVFAANAFGRMEFVFRSPGKQPSLHVFVGDVMTSLELTIGDAEIGENALLVGNIGLDGVGNEEVSAAAGVLGELGKALLGRRLQANAEGSCACVCHEHIVTHFWVERCYDAALEEEMKSLLSRTAVLAAILLGAIFVMHSQQNAALTQRIPQFENDDVKVSKSVVLPTARLAMHRREHPRVIIALSGGTMKIVE